MLLRTLDAWESQENPDRVFGEKGTRRHPVVELTLNVPLLHVDIVLQPAKGEPSLWSRFLFADPQHAVQFVHQDGVEEVRIALQSALDVEGKRTYSIDEVVEIHRCETASGNFVFDYVFDDGRDFLDTANDDDAVVNRISVYKRAA
jgi:hypothetical protein